MRGIKRNEIIEVIKGVIIARTKVIFWKTAQNSQKTSIGLNNLYAGDW